MAYLRNTPKSPYWFIRFKDPDRMGEYVERSTGLRVDSPEETRKARRLADSHTAKERNIGALKPSDSPAFRIWVPGFLANKDRAAGTKRRAAYMWEVAKEFFASEGIIYPNQVKYRHAADYMVWRTGAVSHNTALAELKFIAHLMGEAVRREYVPSNPLSRLGIAKHAQRQKPELSDADIAKIRRHLAGQAPWMLVCFEISLYTGCRFSETEIPMENIDFVAGTIRLRDAKRKDADPRKFFTVPMHPGLRPTLERIMRSGATETCRLTRDKNARINKEFRRAGVDASFHSLRVTFVTRCHRGGLTGIEAMRLVNHSSQLVHRIYSRLGVEDVRAAQTRIPLPSL